jgi:hypothetical protein
MFDAMGMEAVHRGPGGGSKAPAALPEAIGGLPGWPENAGEGLSVNPAPSDGVTSATASSNPCRLRPSTDRMNVPTYKLENDCG